MKISLKSRLLIGGFLASMLPLAISGYFSVSKELSRLAENLNRMITRFKI